MAYTVTLENFEGPLDLLLYLVRKNEIEIQDIPIVLITQQYINYIDLMKALDLDIAGEFLVMASTLLYLKSRALLPKGDNEEDVAEEQPSLDDLKRQLREYQQYKEAAQRLREQNILDKDVFRRKAVYEPVVDDPEALPRDASLFDLLSAFKTILEQAGKASELYAITVEQISVKDRISDVLSLLETSKRAVAFHDLFGNAPSRLELITTFLAILELIKMQAIRAFQRGTFETIYLNAVQDEA